MVRIGSGGRGCGLSCSCSTIPGCDEESSVIPKGKPRGRGRTWRRRHCCKAENDAPYGRS